MLEIASKSIPTQNATAPNEGNAFSMPLLQGMIDS
jgi:hypothetical protein